MSESRLTVCRRALASAAILLTFAGGPAGCSASPHAGRAQLAVLSSSPDMVTGGDARIEVRAAPDVLDSLAVYLDGKQVETQLQRSGERLEGVVSGLAEGRNVLELRAAGGKVLDRIMLVNHPASGPVFTGPQQQPFICRTQESGLGQPIADNREGIGHPVFDTAGRPAGHSRTCSIARRIDHFYFTGSRFKPFDAATGYANPPPDMATLPLAGKTVPFVVRVETGTINRFLYTIAMLAPAPQFDQAAWNRKLVYWLAGGVGIGHQQGTALWHNNGMGNSENLFMPRLLAQGYAVVASSGNQTGVQYNARLLEETALMTKERFIEAYGKPLYTIGLGGSGGAVQQYLFAQNRPRLLDGGVPMQSYPDMVTQTTWVADCPLLEQYFRDDVARNPASQWAVASRRRLIEGSNASDTVRSVVTGQPGTTECVNGWPVAIPTVLNPNYKDAQYDQVAAGYGYPADVFAGVKWTHWNDLANIYGTDSGGFAPNTVDNVGVQYGLAALLHGDIDADEFLRINACVGGWKDQEDFTGWDRAADPFDARNMLRSADCRDPAGQPAARRSGDPAAIARAWSSGHVFSGERLDIPLIDVRPYLEPELNMHNARQAFSARARLLARNRGAAGRQVIWFAGSTASAVPMAMEALAVVDSYLASGQRPPGFADRCIDAAGAPIASGAGVWDGILDERPAGACTRAFPIYSSPRMVAGDSIRGDVFKCARKPVGAALADGTYGQGVPFSAAQLAWLRKIFPAGVCDWN